MPQKIAIELGSVQKTLFLPLWGRAVETRKEKPLLADPAAAEILERVEYDFSSLGANQSPLSRYAWIMRSIWVDDVIRAFLVRHPRATIVNIGCGLDTTFERVDNGQLRWFDLDLPDVIRLRRNFFQESERRRFLAASFLEEGWLEEIQAADCVLFFAAGVFYYFEEREIKAFLLRLADRFPGSEIFFDVSSPYGVKVANKRVIESSGLDEKSYLKWGLEDPQTILGWDRRIQLLQTCFYFGSKGRRLPLNIRLFGMLSDHLKVQYMLHLQL